MKRAGTDVSPDMTTFFHSEGHCPGEEMLAAYADQQLVGDERHFVEKHLVLCDACLRQVGSLVRTQTQTDERTPEALLRSARLIGAKPRPKSLVWQWVPASAAALVAIVAFAFWFSTQGKTGKAVQSNAPVEQAKSAPAAPLQPTAVPNDVNRGSAGLTRMILSPTAGEHIDSAHARFHWSAMPGAQYYEVQVLTEEGNLVWRTREENTSIAMPRNIHLVPGHTYYLLVHAHSRNARVTDSEPVPFTTG